MPCGIMNRGEFRLDLFVGRSAAAQPSAKAVRLVYGRGRLPSPATPGAARRVRETTDRGPRMKILVTGGAGFIGSAVCRLFVGELGAQVLNVDKLTYAANLASLRAIEGHARYAFCRADICDREALAALFREFDPDAVLHLAAESHVDRSIDGPAEFIRTNVEGTYALLEESLAHWRRLPAERAAHFRFHHVSTD